MVTYLTGYTRLWRDAPVLEHIKSRERKGHWVEHTFVHPYVMFMFEGGGVVRAHGCEWRMDGPFVLFARPRGRYAYGPDQTWVEQGLCFDAVDLPPVLEQFPDEPWPMRAPRIVAELIDRMDRLLEHPANPGVADQLDQLARMAITTSRFGIGGDVPVGPVQRVYAAEAWLRENFWKSFEMAKVVRSFGFSEPTFRRAWGRLFSDSPWQYVLNLRVQDAARRLRDEPDKKIAEIAWDCGFTDQRHFATVFRRRMGCSPTDYRGAGTAGPESRT